MRETEEGSFSLLSLTMEVVRNRVEWTTVRSGFINSIANPQLLRTAFHICQLALAIDGLMSFHFLTMLRCFIALCSRMFRDLGWITGGILSSGSHMGRAADSSVKAGRQRLGPSLEAEL